MKKKSKSTPKKQVAAQREAIKKAISKAREKKAPSVVDGYVNTGITGFDSLIEKGIPKNTSVLIAGGAGTGKTIFCLQTLYNAAKKGEKCLYLSFEESEERLKKHMDDFGWDWRPLEKKGLLKIIRKEPFVLTTNIEAMLANAKGELLLDINEILEVIPKGFHPERIVFDSITSIAAAFDKKDEGYRIFIEQLFRFLEKINVTTFLISETEQIPTMYSRSGVEEFLADGVIVFYDIQRENIREGAVEVLKMRGSKHQKMIVAMKITNRGIEIYPEQELFGDTKK